jgi:outer membrane receptor protein involved in Fe transport
VKVGIAVSARADAEMRVASMAEAITVTAAAPAVAETTEVQTNFTQDVIEALPVPRTIGGITGLAPGTVNGVNGFSISGGQSFDNLYTVDGAVIQENLRGQPHNLFIEDAIQETTIQTAGISAEFGNFTGGVVTAITKSGGNEFSGSFRDSLTNPDWTSRSDTAWKAGSNSECSAAGLPNGCIVPVEAGEQLDQLNQQYEATLGGRIIRDRLWFFAAGRLFERDQDRTFSNSNGNYIVHSKDERMEGKVTGAITAKHNVVLAVIDAPVESTNNCQIGCLDASQLDPSVQNPNRFKTLFYNGVITNNFMLEGKATEKKFAFVGFGGEDHDRVTGTPVRLTAPGFATIVNEPFFCGDCRTEDRDNDQYGLKATYFLGSRTLGSHTIVAGLDRWHETRLSDNYQSPSLYVMILGSLAPTINADKTVLVNVRGGANGDQIQNWPILTPSLGSDLNTDSIYINDKWDLGNKWSFNLGLRYDANDSADSIGNVIADDSKFSPRLGATYDVTGNGRFRVNATYGVYVGRLAETVSGVGSAAGNPARFNYRYAGPDILNVPAEEAMRQIWAWFDSQGGIEKTPVISQNVPGATTVIDGSLTSPSVTEYSVGGSTQLGRGFLRVDYIRREWNDFYTSFTNLQTGRTTLPSGAEADKSLVRNSDLFTREYDAVEVQGQYRIGARLNLGGNYTWSRLFGNFIGETSGGGPGSEFDVKTTRPEYNDFERSDMNGPLGSDSPHKIRAWASYDLPTFLGNFNFSVLQRFDSGNPYSLTGSIDIRQSPNFYGTGLAGGVANPGYVTTPTSVSYFFSDRGEFRFDDVTATDLALNYSSNPGWLAGVGFMVQAELINAFNEQAFTHNTSVLTHLNDTSLKRFNPKAGDQPVEGVHWKKGALFGKPTALTTADSNGSFQAPRTFRISLGLRF